MPMREVNFCLMDIAVGFDLLLCIKRVFFVGEICVIWRNVE